MKASQNTDKHKLRVHQTSFHLSLYFSAAIKITVPVNRIGIRVSFGETFGQTVGLNTRNATGYGPNVNFQLPINFSLPQISTNGF